MSLGLDNEFVVVEAGEAIGGRSLVAVVLEVLDSGWVVGH